MLRGTPTPMLSWSQEYMVKGCQIFLTQISAKKEKDKSKGKKLKDVPIVRDFSEVFPEDLPSLPQSSTSEIPDRLDSRSRARSSSTDKKENEEHLKDFWKSLRKRMYAKVFQSVNFGFRSKVVQVRQFWLYPEGSKDLWTYCDANIHHSGLGTRGLMQREKDCSVLILGTSENGIDRRHNPSPYSRSVREQYRDSCGEAKHLMIGVLWKRDASDYTVIAGFRLILERSGCSERCTQSLDNEELLLYTFYSYTFLLNSTPRVDMTLLNYIHYRIQLRHRWGASVWWLSCDSVYGPEVSFQFHADKDTYSASAVDIVVQSCFLDDQLTSLPPRKCMPPDVLLQSSLHPTRSASEYALAQTQSPSCTIDPC
ncbi:hypothetical protein Tco_0184708 [Tanacetum coccineum]